MFLTNNFSFSRWSVERPGGQVFYAYGWRRKGYFVPSHATGVIEAFEKRWHRRCNAYLALNLVLVLVFGRWGLLAGLAGGALLTLLFFKSMRDTFGGFESVPPDPSRSSWAAILQDQAKNTTYAKLIGLCITGLLLMGASVHMWSAGGNRLIAAFSVLFFGSCLLVMAAVLVVKMTSERSSGEMPR